MRPATKDKAPLSAPEPFLSSAAAGLFLQPAALVVEFRKSSRHAPQLRGLGQKSLFCGEHVKKFTACILLILFSLALFVPPTAHADSPSHHKAMNKSQKSYKKSLKRQKKANKKGQKSQKKAMKNWKRNHGA